jgi:hypothetical protein
MAWSNCSAVLAVGTVKGNLQLYFVKERRKVPVAAKHTKRVCAGSWALNENLLALAAQDRTVSTVRFTHACSTDQLQHQPRPQEQGLASNWRSRMKATC